MKKTSTLLIAAAVMLSSCGITARYASSDDGHRFQDGIYGNSPSFITKEEKDKSQKETQDLVDMTKSSQIYLFGDKKDTIAIPENWSARIQFDQKVGGTVVTGDGTLKTTTDITMAHIVLVHHGTGEIMVHIGTDGAMNLIGIHGDITVHGTTTVSMTLGTTAAGMTLGTTAVIGDGMIHGITTTDGTIRITTIIMVRAM